MGSVNRVILVGNLGADCELKHTPQSAAIATMSLATTEKWNGRDGQANEKTEWHRVAVWGKQAESLADYLKKGKQVFVEGRLETKDWQDKDGNKRTTVEVRADRVVLLGGRGHANDEAPQQPRGWGRRSRSESGGIGCWARSMVTADRIPVREIRDLLAAADDSAGHHVFWVGTAGDVVSSYCR